MNADNGATVLPELSDARIDELEQSLFADIARDRLHAQDEARQRTARRKRRRTVTWWTTSAAAVVVITAVAAGPVLSDLLTGGTPTGWSVPMSDSAEESSGGSSDGAAPDGATSANGVIADPQTGIDPQTNREMIATAEATVRVDDVTAAADAVAATAAQAGGYVEAMRIGEDGPIAYDGQSDMIAYPPSPPGGAWITVRVPADKLTGALDGLSSIGTVESSAITRQDVTQQAVDLRARIGALEASVQRLTELLASSGSVSDLITAESALSERQAELDSYRQQLTVLDEQVAMSTLTVSLVTTADVATADPAGFGDGLATGWSGLVATANGVVVAIGFLLPWLAVGGIIALIVWAIVRTRRRRRLTAPDAEADDAS